MSSIRTDISCGPKGQACMIPVFITLSLSLSVCLSACLSVCVAVCSGSSVCCVACVWREHGVCGVCTHCFILDFRTVRARLVDPSGLRSIQPQEPEKIQQETLGWADKRVHSGVFFKEDNLRRETGKSQTWKKTGKRQPLLPPSPPLPLPSQEIPNKPKV